LSPSFAISSASQSTLSFKSLSLQTKFSRGGAATGRRGRDPPRSSELPLSTLPALGNWWCDDAARRRVPGGDGGGGASTAAGCPRHQALAPTPMLVIPRGVVPASSWLTRRGFGKRRYGNEDDCFNGRRPFTGDSAATVTATGSGMGAANRQEAAAALSWPPLVLADVLQLLAVAVALGRSVAARSAVPELGVRSDITVCQA